MGRSVNMVGIMVIFVAALIQSSGAQTTYVVGDSLGWVMPPNDTTYSTWASNKTFTVGDKLEFNFENGAHTVRDVAKSVFDSCNISLLAEGDNPIASSVTITLIASGEHFYMCTVPTHCTAGQRLAINVTGTPIQAPPPPNGSSPSLAVAALPITLLSIAMALLYYI